MEAFIEVTASAALAEQVVEFRADVTLTVRAAQASLLVRASQLETAAKEAGELRDACIRALKAAGLHDAELADGGAQSVTPWFWRKAPAQEAAQKILISCSDMPRLQSGFAALEPLFKNERFSLEATLLPPRFDAPPAVRRAAERAAIEAARAKAENLAESAGARVGTVLQIQELATESVASGAYGDPSHAALRLEAAMDRAVPAAAQPEPLDAAVRATTLHFRVVFALLAGG
jgi:uncharacterized protein YggE